MSILSDNEIRERCIAPETVFDQATYDSLNEQQDRQGWPSHPLLADMIREAFKKRCTHPNNSVEKEAFSAMISPFVDGQVRSRMHSITKPMAAHNGEVSMVTVPSSPSKILSYGLDSHGYDVRLGDDVKIFTNINTVVVDPKHFQPTCLASADIRTLDDGSRYVIMPPNSYALGVTMEVFHMPPDVSALCVGKSTLARCGIIVNPTVINPGFVGSVVLEYSNSSNLPARLYLGEGGAKLLFFRSHTAPQATYVERGGVYQHQMGVQLPIV